MDIYWIQDKRKCGPATVPDIISKVQAGELTEETRGWHKGCGHEWLPLKELPALADFLDRKASEAAQADGSAEAEEAEGGSTAAPQPAPAPPLPLPLRPALPPMPPLPHVEESAPAAALPEGMEGAQRVYLPSPTARLLARFVDYGLYSAAFYGLMLARGIPYDISLMLNANPLLWLPMVAIEAAMLAAWGTTPGKALMGIRMNTFGEAPKLNFTRAFMRSLMVFTLGAGVMMPLMLPVMLALSFWLLRRRGITQWDALCSTLPVQKAPAQAGRYLLAILALYICSVTAGGCMRPWMPAMLADIEKDSPEWAATLRALMPKEKPQAAPAAGKAALPTPAAQPATPTDIDTSLPGM